MQSPAGATLEAILQLHDYICFFLLVIFIFITWFLFNIMVDFSPLKANTKPAITSNREISYKFSSKIVHRGLLEVIWTIIPVLILTAIAVPSFELLYALDTISKPLITVKCIGNQWFWTYESIGNFNNNTSKEIPVAEENDETMSREEYLDYLDFLEAFGISTKDMHKKTYKEFMAEIDALNKAIEECEEGFDSEKKDAEEEIILETPESHSIKMDVYMLDMDEVALGGLRLLETDVFPILPADCEMRFIITSMDVLHSFAVPALGIKVDAIPGRLNQFGIKVRVPGIYFGQCSELCGVGHGFMPIKLQFMHRAA